MIRIPKKINYNVPEGKFSSDLKQVLQYEKQEKGKAERYIRLAFAVTSLKHPRYVYYVGKTFKYSKLEALADFLESWLGPRFELMLDENGELSVESLEDLIEEPADIQVVHIDNDEYDQPFCHLNAIYPPGTLVKDAQEEQAA